jgi:hypothetical protein
MSLNEDCNKIYPEMSDPNPFTATKHGYTNLGIALGQKI